MNVEIGTEASQFPEKERDFPCSAVTRLRKDTGFYSGLFWEACLVRNDKLVKVDEHEILEGVHVAVEAVIQGSEQSLRPARRSAYIN